MSSHPTERTAELERRIIEVLQRAACALDATEVRRRIGKEYSPGEVGCKLGKMADKDILYRAGSVNTLKGRAPTYAMRPAMVDIAKRVRTWTPLRPARQAVIPVREGGRIAPDVSDGVTVVISSRVEHYGRIDA